MNLRLFSPGIKASALILLQIGNLLVAIARQFEYILKVGGDKPPSVRVTKVTDLNLFKSKSISLH